MCARRRRARETRSRAAAGRMASCSATSSYGSSPTTRSSRASRSCSGRSSRAAASARRGESRSSTFAYPSSAARSTGSPRRSRARVSTRSRRTVSRRTFRAIPSSQGRADPPCSSRKRCRHQPRLRERLRGQVARGPLEPAATPRVDPERVPLVQHPEGGRVCSRCPDQLRNSTRMPLYDGIRTMCICAVFGLRVRTSRCAACPGARAGRRGTRTDPCCA